MKHIPLRQLPGDDGAVIDWHDVIRQVIRRPLDPQKGVDIDEMRRGIRVLDALDRCASDVFDLEDADWQHLCAKTQVMPWAIVDRRILQFIDDVTGASELVPHNGLLSKAEVPT